MIARSSTRALDDSSRRFDVRLNAKVDKVSTTRKGVQVAFESTKGPQSVEADVLLIATGRRPNSDRLDAAAGGLDVDDDGHFSIDDTYQTNAPGIWAFGDLANHFDLKHMANAEARVVRHNLVHPSTPETLPFSLVPAAVFADPQVASVGMTEQELQAKGRHYAAAMFPYSDDAFGWALEDTTCVVKILADPDSRLLLGAHIIGPQASILIQPLLQAMCLGNNFDDVARGVLYIHPALSEIVDQTLLAL